jgi:S1-C subfamily serine protease
MKLASDRFTRRWARKCDAFIAWALLTALASGHELAAASPPAASRPSRSDTSSKNVGGATVAANPRRRAPLPADDWTYRPTVVVRRGRSQGSGTIIASVERETLILTAAHVVKDKGPVQVEFHRYNLGLEQEAGAHGTWPRVITGTVAARDAAADVAVVRLEGMTALPFVARIAPDYETLPRDSFVSSVGIDLGHTLSMWSTRLVETVTFELNESRELRPFLITEKIPEHGRSGGGLFTPSGELVGVCVGHTELEKGRRRGVFAAPQSVHLLLFDHQMTGAVRRSEVRMTRRTETRSSATRTDAGTTPSTVVTTARSGADARP